MFARNSADFMNKKLCKLKFLAGFVSTGSRKRCGAGSQSEGFMGVCSLACSQTLYLLLRKGFVLFEGFTACSSFLTDPVVTLDS